MFLHTDTETTGIPVHGMPSDFAGHPHLLSLTGLLDDGPDATLGEVSTLIIPDGYRTEDFPEAFKIHGITTEQATDEGRPLADVVEEYVALARRAESFVAFSAFFDFKMLKIACARLHDKPLGESFRQELENLTSICTMESAAMHLIGKKRMKLKDAYWELFKEETQTERHHGSHKDAMASRRIFWELQRRGGLAVPKSLERKQYDSPPPTEPPVAARGKRPAPAEEEAEIGPARRPGKPAAI